MEADIRTAIAAGAHGVVFGALRPDATIDAGVMRRLIDVARPLPVTCHKAIDATRDPLEALEALLAPRRRSRADVGRRRHGGGWRGDHRAHGGAGRRRAGGDGRRWRPSPQRGRARPEDRRPRGARGRPADRECDRRAPRHGRGLGARRARGRRLPASGVGLSVSDGARESGRRRRRARRQQRSPAAIAGPAARRAWRRRRCRPAGRRRRSRRSCRSATEQQLVPCSERAPPAPPGERLPGERPGRPGERRRTSAGARGMISGHGGWAGYRRIARGLSCLLSMADGVGPGFRVRERAERPDR